MVISGIEEIGLVTPTTNVVTYAKVGRLVCLYHCCQRMRKIISRELDNELINRLWNEFLMSPWYHQLEFPTLQWRHNDHDGISNHQPHGCLLNRLQTQINENIKAPRHWPLCGEFTGTGEFPAQRASYGENVSIWWRHHVLPQVNLLPWNLSIEYNHFWKP